MVCASERGDNPRALPVDYCPYRCTSNTVTSRYPKIETGISKNTPLLICFFCVLFLYVMQCTVNKLARPSQGFWGTGKKGIYFWGTGEQMPDFEGNKDNIGEHGT